VRYYATASGPLVRDAMRVGLLGMIATPTAGNTVPTGVDWCADNSAYAGHYPGDDQYLAWLSRHAAHAPRCAFATAPDVVGDAAATLARSTPMLARIRDAGYPVALVAQDGLENLPIPWHDLDALFLGGTTAWKLGPAAAGLAARARRHGLWVHMGRVNSLRRLRYAASIGCQSADGTFLAYGPDRNLPTLLGWLRTVAQETTRGTRLASRPGIGVDQVMTDINDGHGDVRPLAPAHPEIDRTAAQSGPASAHTPTGDSDSCEHPAIVIRPGPPGPRAALFDGPDVWEVIAALHALRDEEPTRHGEVLRSELRTATGLTTAQVAAALDYYAAHPEDVDTRIAANNETAERTQRPPTAGGPPPRNHAT
jgi:hypothetical protein